MSLLCKLHSQLTPCEKKEKFEYKFIQVIEKDIRALFKLVQACDHSIFENEEDLAVLT